MLKVLYVYKNLWYEKKIWFIETKSSSHHSTENSGLWNSLSKHWIKMVYDLAAHATNSQSLVWKAYEWYFWWIAYLQLMKDERFGTTMKQMYMYTQFLYKLWEIFLVIKEVKST